MEFLSLVHYFVVLVVLAASPGPQIAVLIARSLGNDWKGAAFFAAGLCLGEVIAVVAVMHGIGAWTKANPQWLTFARYGGCAYLFWIAWRMWSQREGVKLVDPSRADRLAAVLGGVAICLGNPATLLVQLLLLPLVAPGGVVRPEDMMPVALATFAAFGLVFFGAIPLARRFNEIVSSPGPSRVLNRVSAAAIALTSGWILVG